MTTLLHSLYPLFGSQACGITDQNKLIYYFESATAAKTLWDQFIALKTTVPSLPISFFSSYFQPFLESCDAFPSQPHVYVYCVGIAFPPNSPSNMPYVFSKALLQRLGTQQSHSPATNQASSPSLEQPLRMVRNAPITAG